MDAKLPYVSATDKKTAYDKVKVTVKPEVLESKFGVKATLEYFDAEMKILAKGKGFDFKVDFLDDGAELSLNLSLLLKPLKSKVLAVLEKEIGRVL